MSTEWDLRSLSDVGVSVLDCEHKTPVDAGVGFPYIAIPNLVDGRVDLTGVRRISAEDLAVWTRRTRPTAGDVIVTRRGRVGDTAVIPEHLSCAIGQNLVLLRSDGKIVRQDYLRWSTRSPLWRSEVERLLNVGAIFDSLNVRDIARLRIPIPPICEQAAIAGILGALDDKIVINDQVVKGALRLASASYSAGVLPESQWREVRLNEVATVAMGQSPPGESCNRRGEGTPLLNGPTEFGSFAPSPAQWTNQPTRLSDTGDLLLCVRGSTTGRLNWADRQYAIGRGLAAIRANRSRRHTILVYFGIVERMNELLAVADGSVFPNLPRAEVESLLIPWPEDVTVDEVCELLGPLTDLASVRETENRTLTALRDTLLPGLMSGEIRVRDAEIVVEEVL